jgi:hypothetical protein
MFYIAYVADGTLVGEHRETLAEGGAQTFSFPGSGEGEILISYIDEEGRVQAIAGSVMP